MVVIISGVGKDADSLFVGIKEFSAQKVYLLTDKSSDSKVAIESLNKFKVKYEVVELDLSDWMGSFRRITSILKKDNKRAVLNCSIGSNELISLVCSVGFIEGVKMYTYYDEKIRRLPTLNASYYDLLTTKKDQILRVLSDGECCKSMDELSKKTGMSLPLISYHINGNIRTQGLKALGLVETKEEKGRVKLTLSPIGKIMIEGR